MKTGFCPHCTGEVEFPENTVGLESSCPYCDEEFILMEAGGGSILNKPAVLYSLLTVVTAGAIAGGVLYFKGDKTEVAKEESPDQLAQLADSLGAPPSQNPFSGAGAPPPPPPGGGMSMGMDNGMMNNGMMDNGMMDNGMAAMAGGAAGGVTFAKDIKPIFERACVKCHGPNRQRGDLRIDTIDQVKSAQVATAGQAARSALFTRVSLPPGDDDLMPPKGGPLPAAEVDLIKRWIDGGMR